ncbi:MAG: lysophospholipase [Treponema sp.]|nr:lysophospholipase [Treponema sp.]
MEWIPMNDGVRLYLRRWALNRGGPESKVQPWAVLHIAHGMAEHSLRYERLARKLNEAGIEVWAADMRGHGKTAAEGGNDPGKGGLLGHCSDKSSSDRVCADIDAINRKIALELPGIPLFLMGHSWGSFIAQYYIETLEGKKLEDKPPVRLSGCILSGSRGPGGLKIKFGFPFIALIAFLKRQRKGSRLARSMADGPYSKPFRPNRSAFDWLSRDEAEVDKFVNDPLCGFLCSSGFYRDLTGLLKKIHRGDLLQNIRKELPVYVFSGSADPVGEMGESPTALVAAYRAQGLKDLEFALYPEARHETLNETNRDEVTGNLLSWLLSRIGS